MHIRQTVIQLLPRTVCFVAILVCSLGCGSGWHGEFSKMMENTKRQHKASDVQAALAPFFSGQRMLTNQLPQEITSLPIFADDPTNIEISQTLDSTNVLMLHIGGGFGHWGLIVARQGHDQEISKWCRERLTPWEDGVYFYDNK